MWTKLFTLVVRYKSAKPPSMKYLNVAEKNDAAKNIAGFLSRGSSTRREGFSVYNKIYEFTATVHNQQVTMITTSVSGHLYNCAFDKAYKNWQQCDPISLFDAPVYKVIPDNSIKIKQTLEREIRKCQALIIWTDCDREGENIGSEIVEVCKAVKPNITVYRAKFSEITSSSIHRALNNLGTINKNVSNAVDIRQELDLRIGAAFTRFQTLRLQRNFSRQIANQLVSYGSCQFPTLGFVVQRYKEAQQFIPQYFWKIRVLHTIRELTVEFNWKRNRLFDEQTSIALHSFCMQQPEAEVLKVEGKQKTKWRPLPMDTIELEKLSSRKLKIGAKETMKIAEKLYTKGFISYPRTETNIFPKDFNLRQYVELQTQDNRWGAFAQKILDNGGPNPRAGKKSDQAHPPIHPTKHALGLAPDENKVYELVVRHFLACVSKDAVGFETTCEIKIAEEEFKAVGLCILERNYLEVYPYDKWNVKEIHNYEINQKFIPSSIDLVPGITSAPNLLTEADLIVLMDKHGIGTDATHAEHISTVKDRQYIGEDGGYLVPGVLGMGLVEGYDMAGLEMSKPHLRAALEADLKLVCDGVKQPKTVLDEQLKIYREVFRKITEKAIELDNAIASRFAEANTQNGPAPARAPYRPPGAPPPASIEFKPPQPDGPGDDDRGNGGVGNVHRGDNSEDDDDDNFGNHGQNGYQSNSRGLGNTDYSLPSRGATSSCGRGGSPAKRLPKKNEADVAKKPKFDDESIPAAFFDDFPMPNELNQEVLCEGCQQQAKKLTVQKDGPNKGREFYVCPKPMDQQCKFFKWADDDPRPSNNWSSVEPAAASRGRGRGRGAKGTTTRGRGKSKAPSTGSTRKCGNCQQTGHNRKNCPNISHV